jgi:RNA polymerase sigma-70 factor (ECF subfamily)
MAIAVADLRDASTSLSLLERARRRDDAAWERLTLLYQPLVLHWCRRSGLCDADCADVQQEVFFSVSRAVATFDRSGHGAFRCWLRTIARRKIEDRRRARLKDRLVDAAAAEAQPARTEKPTDDPDENQVGEEKQVLVHRAIQLIRTDFQDDTWMSFWRVVVDGQPPANVAKDLGITRNAVYLAKARVLSRLREEFEDLLDI